MWLHPAFTCVGLCPLGSAGADDAVQSSLELRIRYADRPRQVVPINRAAFEHDVDGGRARRGVCREGRKGV